MPEARRRKARATKRAAVKALQGSLGHVEQSSSEEEDASSDSSVEPDRPRRRRHSDPLCLFAQARKPLYARALQRLPGLLSLQAEARQRSEARRAEAERAAERFAECFAERCSEERPASGGAYRATPARQDRSRLPRPASGVRPGIAKSSLSRALARPPSALEIQQRRLASTGARVRVYSDLVGRGANEEYLRQLALREEQQLELTEEEVGASEMAHEGSLIEDSQFAQYHRAPSLEPVAERAGPMPSREQGGWGSHGSTPSQHREFTKGV